MPDLNRALAEAAEEVLSTMFFTSLDAPPAVVDRLARPRVRVRFNGQWAGCLSLYLSPGASAEVTASFLGLEGSEPPGPQQLDAVSGELANMICGSVLSRLDGSAVFELLSPEPANSFDAGESQDVNTQTAEQTFGVCGGFLHLTFCLHELP